MVSLAEIIEIADNVAERRDRKSGQTSQPQGTTSGSSGGKHRHPHTDASGSVRAVTFESQRRSQGHGKSSQNRSRTRQPGPSRSGTPRTCEATPADRGKSRGGSAPPNNQPRTKHTFRKTRQLSDKEKTEYRAARRCFGCGKGTSVGIALIIP